MQQQKTDRATPRPKPDDWNGVRIGPGESRDLDLEVGESYSGAMVRIPLHVRRGAADGPTVFITAALHGDELNGSGAIRALLQDASFGPERGALILVPVLNVPAFDRHSRYLPDRRDLNRSFPGSSEGSLARRLARVIFDEIVQRSDFGIDLHTAAVRRTNFPTVRADLDDPQVERLAQGFGCELILRGKGPQGSLRRSACEAGCPTIALEAGEVWKVEPTIVEYTVRGITNALAALDMRAHPATKVSGRLQIVVEKTKWVRAERGGFLQFHVAPGDVVERDQELATNTSLLGHEQNVLTAPFDGVVIGMTTLPAVSPGEPVCHLARLKRDMKEFARRWARGLRERVLDDLASNVLVVEPDSQADGRRD